MLITTSFRSDIAASIVASNVLGGGASAVELLLRLLFARSKSSIGFTVLREKIEQRDLTARGANTLARQPTDPVAGRKFDGAA